MDTYSDLQNELNKALKELENEEERIGTVYSNKVNQWLYNELVNLKKEYNLKSVSIIFGNGTYSLTFCDSEGFECDIYSLHEASEKMQEIDKKLNYLMEDKLNYMRDIYIIN